MNSSDDENPPEAFPSREREELDSLWDESVDTVPSERANSHSISSVVERRGSRHIWLISYADFMTILMIFFLAMYGYTYLAKESLMRQQPTLNASDFSQQINRMKDKLGNQIKIQEDVDKVVLHVDDQILFASGRAEINPSAAGTLDDLAKSVKLIHGDVIVQGHTDNVPVGAGKYRSNWELSAARSFSVIDALQSRGVAVARLAAWGLGENRPIVDNETPEHRAKNRRIDVIILKKKNA